MFEGLFARPKPGPASNEKYNASIEKRDREMREQAHKNLEAELARDPLERVRTEHPDLFPKTPQGEQLLRATVRNRNEIPEEVVVKMVFRVLGL